MTGSRKVSKKIYRVLHRGSVVPASKVYYGADEIQQYPNKNWGIDLRRGDLLCIISKVDYNSGLKIKWGEYYLNIYKNVFPVKFNYIIREGQEILGVMQSGIVPVKGVVDGEVLTPITKRSVKEVPDRLIRLIKGKCYNYHIGIYFRPFDVLKRSFPDADYPRNELFNKVAGSIYMSALAYGYKKGRISEVMEDLRTYLSQRYKIENIEELITYYLLRVRVFLENKKLRP